MAMIIQPAPTASWYEAVWKMPRLGFDDSTIVRSANNARKLSVEKHAHLTPMVAMTKATVRKTESCGGDQTRTV